METPRNNSIPHQNIRQVDAGDGSQVVAGVVHGNVIFGNHEGSRDEGKADAIKACKTALFLTDPAIDRATLISQKGQRVPDTCAWIKENETYRSWLDGNKPLL